MTSAHCSLHCHCHYVTVSPPLQFGVGEGEYSIPSGTTMEALPRLTVLAKNSNAIETVTNQHTDNTDKVYFSKLSREKMLAESIV